MKDYISATVATNRESASPSDIEDGREKTSGDSTFKHPRMNLPLWKWTLTLIGIYVGALLYGMRRSLIPSVILGFKMRSGRERLIVDVQDSIQLSPQMFRLQYLNHLGILKNCLGLELAFPWHRLP